MSSVVESSQSLLEFGSPVAVPPSPTVYAPAENCGQKLQTACSPKTPSFAPVRRRCSPTPWRPRGSRNTQKSSTLTCILTGPVATDPSAGAECRHNGCKAFGARGQARAPWHIQTVAIVLTDRLLPSEVPTAPPLDGTLCGGHLAERCSASGDATKHPVAVTAFMLCTLVLCQGRIHVSNNARKIESKAPHVHRPQRGGFRAERATPAKEIGGAWRNWGLLALLSHLPWL